ncbi:hypothetical protein [uncultured Eudoraea sp.]|uniref:hypothetical protein n=1 Tax=uncultured Eudoraea sp. TaxID=1035614 RepID=UPI00261223C3|nr:hypothetical protein [uncultured Eudoraea sp.]
MKRIFPIVFLLLTITSSFAQTDGDKNPILTDRFLIRGALFVPSRTVEAGAKGDIPTDELGDIDFDENFGLGGAQNTFNIDFVWRFSKSKFWSVRGQTFRVAAEGDAVLDEDIEWEDVIFQAGSGVKAGYGLTLYRVFFGRVISTGQKHELGGGLGIHGLNTNAFVEGNGFVNDQPIGFSREEVNIFLPLPNIGVWYIWAPTQKWAFSAAVDWFGITIGEISGGLWNLSPGVNFQAFKNIGFSVNYHYLNYYANIEQDTWNGSFDMTFKGPSFGVTANF